MLRAVRPRRAKYWSRVSFFAAVHFCSVARIRRLTSCQIRKSKGFKSGLRFGRSNVVIPTSFLALSAASDLYPVGSLSSKTTHAGFSCFALVGYVLRNPFISCFVYMVHAAFPLHLASGFSAHIKILPLPIPPMMQAAFMPVLYFNSPFGFTYQDSYFPSPGPRYTPRQDRRAIQSRCLPLWYTWNHLLSMAASKVLFHMAGVFDACFLAHFSRSSLSSTERRIFSLYGWKAILRSLKRRSMVRSETLTRAERFTAAFVTSRLGLFLSAFCTSSLVLFTRRSTWAAESFRGRPITAGFFFAVNRMRQMVDWSRPSFSAMSAGFSSCSWYMSRTSFLASSLMLGPRGPTAGLGAMCTRVSPGEAAHPAERSRPAARSRRANEGSPCLQRPSPSPGSWNGALLPNPKHAGGKRGTTVRTAG